MTINPLTPLTNIRILANVPLDSSYTDTLTFSGVSAQINYFQGKTKYTVPAATPVRMQDVIRVPYVADLLYDCNYIMFQNANFGNKWFYAFITKIDYKDPNRSDISFELDVMQTWYFDYTLQKCLVEREHVDSDELNEHLLSEPFEPEEMVLEPAVTSGRLDEYTAVIMYAKDDAAGDGLKGGLFTGLTFMSAPLSASGAGAMLDLLQSLTTENKQDQVVASYIMPSSFYTTDADAKEYQIGIPIQQTSLGDYTPRNKKLLSWPYNFLQVSNSMGRTQDFRYEYFDQITNAIFHITCPMGCQPEVILWAQDYDHQPANMGKMLTITGFPQFAYVIDTYRAWLAQQGNNFITEIATQAADTSIGRNAVTLGSFMPDTTLLGGLTNALAPVQNKTIMPNTAGGGLGTNAMVAIKKKDFYFYQVHVREDLAASLDDMFDMYGYRVDSLKVPNVNGRPSWNYVKTAECKATGSVPFDDLAKIKSIYNKGITFWHGDYVGDYSRNNKIGG